MYRFGGLGGGEGFGVFEGKGVLLGGSDGFFQDDWIVMNEIDLHELIALMNWFSNKKYSKKEW